MGKKIFVPDNYSIEVRESTSLEKDGYYRRLQEKRKRDYKLAREKHQKWLEEQGLKWS